MKMEIFFEHINKIYVKVRNYFVFSNSLVVRRKNSNWIVTFVGFKSYRVYICGLMSKDGGVYIGDVFGVWAHIQTRSELRLKPCICNIRFDFRNIDTNPATIKYSWMRLVFMVWGTRTHTHAHLHHAYCIYNVHLCIHTTQVPTQTHTLTLNSHMIRSKTKYKYVYLP